MVSANMEMAVYCFDNLVAHYTSELVPPPAFDEGQHPLFVTWKKVVGGEPRLRGCIGTLEARCLFNGFKDYALTSALRDRRFPPIQAREIPYLECTVSILTDYEPATNYLDWEVGKHGMIMEFSDPDNTRRSATYLPEVAAQEEICPSLDSSICHTPVPCRRLYLERTPASCSLKLGDSLLAEISISNLKQIFQRYCWLLYSTLP